MAITDRSTPSNVKWKVDGRNSSTAAAVSFSGALRTANFVILEFAGRYNAGLKPGADTI